MVKEPSPRQWTDQNSCYQDSSERRVGGKLGHLQKVSSSRVLTRARMWTTHEAAGRINVATMPTVHTSGNRLLWDCGAEVAVGSCHSPQWHLNECDSTACEWCIQPGWSRVAQRAWPTMDALVQHRPMGPKAVTAHVLLTPSQCTDPLLLSHFLKSWCLSRWQHPRSKHFPFC